MRIVGAAIFMAVGIIPRLSPRSITWDETYHMRLASQLWRQGFSIHLLREMTLATGPLYAAILALMKPIFSLNPGHGARLLTWLFLGATLFFAGKLMKSFAGPSNRTCLSLLGIPLLTLMGAFAMSDIPVLCMFFISLFIWRQATLCSERSKAGLFFSCLAGLFMGLAIIGRQTYLVGLVGFLWIGLKCATLKKRVLLFFLFMAPIPITLFACWKGLTSQPIQLAESSAGYFSATHLLLGISQSALLYCLFEPALVTRNWKKNAMIIGVFLLLTPLVEQFIITDLTQRLPIRSVFQYFFGALHPWIARVLLGASFGLGFLFLKEIGHRFLTTQEPQIAGLYLSGLALILVSGCVAHNYSSRYPLPGLMLLVILHEITEVESMTTAKVVRLGMGGILGLGVAAYYLGLF